MKRWLGGAGIGIKSADGCRVRRQNRILVPLVGSRCTVRGLPPE